MGRGISHSLKWGYIGDYRDILYGSVMEMEILDGWQGGGGGGGGGRIFGFLGFFGVL
jgi:hypothetical protein